MESKEFWDKMLEEANRNMPKEYQLVFDETVESTGIPDNAEGKVFATTWKDGKQYGKGMYFEQKFMNEDTIQSMAPKLAMSMKNCFENLEEDIANGKTTQDN